MRFSITVANCKTGFYSTKMKIVGLALAFLLCFSSNPAFAAENLTKEEKALESQLIKVRDAEGFESFWLAYTKHRDEHRDLFNKKNGFARKYFPMIVAAQSIFLPESLNKSPEIAWLVNNDSKSKEILEDHADEEEWRTFQTSLSSPSKPTGSAVVFDGFSAETNREFVEKIGITQALRKFYEAPSKTRKRSLSPHDEDEAQQQKKKQAGTTSSVSAALERLRGKDLLATKKPPLKLQISEDEREDDGPPTSPSSPLKQTQKRTTGLGSGSAHDSADTSPQNKQKKPSAFSFARPDDRTTSDSGSDNESDDSPKSAHVKAPPVRTEADAERIEIEKELEQKLKVARDFKSFDLILTQGKPSGKKGFAKYFNDYVKGKKASDLPPEQVQFLSHFLPAFIMKRYNVYSGKKNFRTEYLPFYNEEYEWLLQNIPSLREKLTGLGAYVEDTVSARRTFYNQYVNNKENRDPTEEENFNVAFELFKAWAEEQESNKPGSSDLPPSISGFANDFGEEVKNSKKVFKNTDQRVINQLLEAMIQDGGSAAVILGESGSGKTEVVKTFVRMVQNEKLPATIQDQFPPTTKFISVDARALSAGTGITGKFEEKVKNLVDYCQKTGAVLILDEMHTLKGQGTHSGQKNEFYFFDLLKGAMTDSDKPFRIIGMSTDSEYNKAYSENDAIMRRFTQIKKDALPVSTDALKSWAKTQGHKPFSPEIHKRIIQLAKAYDPIGSDFIKATNLAKAVYARQRIQGSKPIEITDVEEIAKTKYKIDPAYFDLKARQEKLAGLGKFLEETIVGDGYKNIRQDLVDETAAIFAGGRDIEKPALRIAFVGPPGTGKTYSVENYAKYMGLPYVRINFAQFGHGSTIEDLLRQVGQAIMTNPFSVILFDEIEKVPYDMKEGLLGFLDSNSLMMPVGSGSNKTMVRVRTDHAKVFFASNAADEAILRNPNITEQELRDVLSNDRRLSPALVSRFSAVQKVPLPDKKAFKAAMEANLIKILKKQSENDSLNITINNQDEFLTEFTEAFFTEGAGYREALSLMTNIFGQALTKKRNSGKCAPEGDCELTLEFTAKAKAKLEEREKAAAQQKEQATRTGQKLSPTSTGQRLEETSEAEQCSLRGSPLTKQFMEFCRSLGGETGKRKRPQTAPLGSKRRHEIRETDEETDGQSTPKRRKEREKEADGRSKEKSRSSARKRDPSIEPDQRDRSKSSSKKTRHAKSERRRKRRTEKDAPKTYDRYQTSGSDSDQ